MTSIYDKMTTPEEEVARYLKEAGLWWEFEFPVFVYEIKEDKEKRRPRLWTPDFYLPTLGVYIEVCGSKEFNYEFRKQVYYQNGISVVFLHYYKRQKKWKFFLQKEIEKIEDQRKIEAKKLTKML